MSTKSQISENIEPSVELHEVFENAGDRERREYAEAGCDYGYFVIQFLRGRRRLDISVAEIVATQTYARSDDIEQKALRMVCESDYPEVPVSEEDALKLRSRDNFLCEYVDRKTLGHADSVRQLTSIPQKVAERQYFDSALFGGRVYTSPVIFRWIWEAR